MSTARVEAEPGYVLHVRAYRDTSAIIDVFSRHHGRVSAVAKGLKANTKGRQRWRADLQPGNLLFLSWSGRGELKTLSDVKLNSRFPLKGDALYCAFYVNELLQRLLHPLDPQPDIFSLYGQCLLGLSRDPEPELALRHFEFALLNQLGYGVDFSALDDCPAASVGFHPEQGFLLPELLPPDSPRFPVADLQRIASYDFDADSLKVAKQLSRLALAPLLGGRPLNSRKLFMQARKRSYEQK